jgi:hypothetical protein
MANTTVNKRQKERNRQDKAKEKEEKRKRRRQERAERPEGEAGIDPDIAGIVPGPQPIPEEDY